MNALFTAIFSKFNHKALTVGAAVNVGGGVVGIPCAAHGFLTGDTVTFVGTTNYDAAFTVLASSTANQINITSAFTAETFAATDYAENALYTAIGGRMYHVKAPQSATFPYVVYEIITATDELDFSQELQVFQVQFDIFTENNSASSAGTILGYLESLYDDCSMTVTGWRFLSMVREFVMSNNDISQVPPIMGYSVQYEIQLEKAK
ncbi:MAG: DUF3168 domain-containing protein [Pseudomonadota bacterium]